MMTEYDAIFIGAGQANPFLAAKFAGIGKKVALVEGNKIGGSCVNYGCIPTKLIIASARVAYLARRGAEFGVSTSEVKVDLGKVMARKDERVGMAQSNMENWMRGNDNIDVYDDYGTFVGTENGLYRVQVGGKILQSAHVYINTGTRAFVPPIEGLDEVDYLDNKGILALRDLPSHLIVLGGGYIGLEFGQAFRRFGSEVTIIEATPRLLMREDEDVAEEVEHILAAEDVDIRTNQRAVRVHQDADGIHVTVQDDRGTESVISGSHLLVSIGRRPNTDTLGLENVGVEITDRGFIQVDETLQTNMPGIWALGDVNGHGAFTHTSYHDHEIVWDNMQGAERKVNDRTMAYAMFIDPPLGRVGLSEQQARESGRNVLMSIRPMTHIGRALEQSETFGFIKMLVDADTEQIIGATVLGYNGDDVTQAISYFMETGASYRVMKRALPIHPTIAEQLPTVLEGLKPISD